MNWHKRLTIAREAKNLKKSAFAKLVEVSAPTVTDWENAETKMIDGANLVKVCSVLGIRSKWLMEGELPMDDQQPALSFSDLSGLEAQLVMFSRSVPKKAQERILQFANDIKETYETNKAGIASPSEEYQSDVLMQRDSENKLPKTRNKV